MMMEASPAAALIMPEAGFLLEVVIIVLESKNLPFPVVIDPAAPPDPATAPCPQLHRNDLSPVGCRNCSDLSPVRELRPPRSVQPETEFMRQ
jgi:hypothetical protein